MEILKINGIRKNSETAENPGKWKVTKFPIKIAKINQFSKGKMGKKILISYTFFFIPEKNSRTNFSFSFLCFQLPTKIDSPAFRRRMGFHAVFGNVWQLSKVKRAIRIFITSWCISGCWFSFPNPRAGSVTRHQNDCIKTTRRFNGKRTRQIEQKTRGKFHEISNGNYRG